jgi:hypothetical protein
MTNHDRGRQALAAVLVGVGWVLAVWVAQFAIDEWQIVRGPFSNLGPNRLVLILAAIGGLAAWWLASWLHRAPRPWLTAVARWLAAVGVCVIGLVTVRPFSVVWVPHHDVFAFVSMYFQVLTWSSEGPLLVAVGVVLCLPKLVLVMRGHPGRQPTAELVGDRVT